MRYYQLSERGRTDLTKSYDYPFNFITEVLGTNFIERFVDMSMDTSKLTCSVDEVIGQMEPETIEIMNMRFKEKKTYADISKKMGISISNVRKIIKCVTRDLIWNSIFTKVFIELIKVSPVYPFCVLTHLDDEILKEMPFGDIIKYESYLRGLDATIMWAGREGFHVMPDDMEKLRKFDARVFNNTDDPSLTKDNKELCEHIANKIGEGVRTDSRTGEMFKVGSIYTYMENLIHEIRGLTKKTLELEKKIHLLENGDGRYSSSMIMTSGNDMED